MTERLHFHFSLSCIGEGNGNPLQCSCLENPRDGGSSWAAVYGVAQSRTRLTWRSSSSSSSSSKVDTSTDILWNEKLKFRIVSCLKSHNLVNGRASESAANPVWTFDHFSAHARSVSKSRPTLWDAVDYIARKVPMCMEFPRQEY